MSDKQWATKEERQKNITKLRNALQNYKGTQNENAEDLEQQICDKSNSLDEYLHNLSKVLVVCRDKVHVQSQEHHQLPPGMQHGIQGHPGAIHPGAIHHPQMNTVQMNPVQMDPAQMDPAQMNPAQMNPAQMNQMHPAMLPGPVMAPGPVMSPGPVMAPGARMAPVRRQMYSAPPQEDENALYSMKLAELQKKYIVRLQKVKEKTDHKKGDSKKIHEILDVLMTNRKIKLETLLSIENVLDKLFKSSEQGSVEKSGTSIEKPIVQQNTKHFCQHLIDGVANHACNSSLYHTIKRTFGPALYSLHGDVTLYPPAKRPKKGEPTTLDIVDSEVERLPPCFKAQVKNRSRGDVEVEVRYLKCKIVPCLTVVIPKKYPDQSPWIKKTHNRLGKAVEKALKNKLVTMSMNYTLTQILLCWKNCIVKTLADGIHDVAD